MSTPKDAAIGLGEFQKLIERIYYKKDEARGLDRTFMWFAEEVGELTRAIRRQNDRANLEEEFADVLAWLSTLASLQGIDLQAVALQRYGSGCPYCSTIPCGCGTG